MQDALYKERHCIVSTNNSVQATQIQTVGLGLLPYGNGPAFNLKKKRTGGAIAPDPILEKKKEKVARRIV